MKHLRLCLHFVLAMALLHVQVNINLMSLISLSVGHERVLDLSFSSAWADTAGDPANHQATSDEFVVDVNHQMEGTGVLVAEQIISILTLWAGAFLAFFLVLGCNGTKCGVDIPINVISAVLFLGGEIVTWFGYKQALYALEDEVNFKCNGEQAERERAEAKKMGVEVSNKCQSKEGLTEQEMQAQGLKEGSQYNTLRAQRDSYQKIRDLTVWKTIFQAAATVGWGAAAIAAGVQHTSVGGAIVAQITAILTQANVTGQAAATAARASVGGAAEAFAHDACLLAINAAGKASVAFFETKWNTPGDNAGTECFLLDMQTREGVEAARPACVGASAAWGEPAIQQMKTAYMTYVNPEVPPYYCTRFFSEPVENATKGAIGVGAFIRPAMPNFLTPTLDELPYATAFVNYAKKHALAAAAKDMLTKALEAMISSVHAQESMDQKAKTFDVAGGMMFATVFLNGALLVTLVTISAIYSKELSAIFSKPLGRMWFHLAMAGLAGTVTGLNFGVIVEMDKNIETIDTLLKNTVTPDSLTDVSDDGAPNFADLSTLFMGLGGPDSLPTGDGTGGDCPMGKDVQGNCLPIPDVSSDGGFAFNSLPPGMATDLTKLGNDILKSNQSISKGTLGGAVKVANQAANVRNRLKQLKEHMKKSGIDPDIGANKLLASMQAATLKGLKDTGKTTADLNKLMASAVAPGMSEESKKKVVKKLAGKDKKDGQAAVVAQAEMPFMDLGGAKVPSFGGEADSALKDLDVKMDDIVKNGGASIFTVISTRYLKSAFPVFFREQLPTTAAPARVPANVPSKQKPVIKAPLK